MNTQINHFCELFLYHQYVKQTGRWIVSFIHQLTDVVIAVHFVFVIAGTPPGFCGFLSIKGSCVFIRNTHEQAIVGPTKELS